MIRRDKGALFLFLCYRFMFLVLFGFDVIGFVAAFKSWVVLLGASPRGVR